MRRYNSLRKGLTLGVRAETNVTYLHCVAGMVLMLEGASGAISWCSSAMLLIEWCTICVFRAAPNVQGKVRERRGKL